MAEQSPVEASVLLKHLTEIELAAEEILTDRREIIELDRQRNKTREAIRNLHKEKENKTWLCSGKMFLKVERKKAIDVLEKDYDELDKEITKVRIALKPKVSKLRDLENKDDLKGFELQALSKEELDSVKTLL